MSPAGYVYSVNLNGASTGSSSIVDDASASGNYHGSNTVTGQTETERANYHERFQEGVDEVDRQLGNNVYNTGSKALQNQSSPSEQHSAPESNTFNVSKQREFVTSPVINIVTPGQDAIKMGPNGATEEFSDDVMTYDISRVNGHFQQQEIIESHGGDEKSSPEAERGDDSPKFKVKSFKESVDRTMSEGADSVFATLNGYQGHVSGETTETKKPVMVDEAISPNQSLPSISIGDLPVADSDIPNKYARIRIKNKQRGGKLEIPEIADMEKATSLREVYKKRKSLSNSVGNSSDLASSANDVHIDTLEELNTYLRAQADIDTQSERSGTTTQGFYSLEAAEGAWKV